MWASCCGLLCLDDSTVEDTRSSSRHQAFTNSGFNSYPSSPAPEHMCKACGGRFDSLARKHMCMDCKKSYCSQCSAQQDLQPWLCHTCQRFQGILFAPAELMKLKVKDLRDYLHLHGVPTQTCREKEELVELVLGQQTPTSETHISPPVNTDTDQEAPNTPIITASPSENNAALNLGPQTQATEDEQSLSVAEPTAESEMDTDLQVEQDFQLSDSEEVLVPGRRASLSDLRSVEDIEALSVRQLKEILARNFVDYKGCCEKWELMERVTRLYHDQKDLQNMVTITTEGTDTGSGTAVEENLCKICMDSPIDCVLLECGHMVTCTKCGKRMNECPICRQYVVRAVHVFRS
ncbi:E3 ubiquitin-protein ligase rififylin-like isoform X1 [Myxocyprinus asiaticus]|uniref:E3 ubiquitin-protein ligase rififylin-like isoform X1 n=1 Tax=Myxocyprinus asiaticus TaxID=70543 RepID=UPI0022222EBA|nr:E3 ubiquitin-protein ligase rififylin-like isoform X1 [Myxocyprinus asiaticus]XP_051521264.1 E3 ubiquitin-protein ligase rififylin-like isoform X1 [Myxocyprinus asiaticus]XP_051521265.1 E3 ubiquitin-protein ligase rififylin-like isoform X1 [Myxocyprinus asiaticus]